MTLTVNSPEAEVNAVFRSLRELDQTLVNCGVNKNDRAAMLINACINEGIDTGKRIVGALACVGFNSQHIGMTLKHGLQKAPEWPGWGRHDDGTYFAPPEASALD